MNAAAVGIAVWLGVTSPSSAPDLQVEALDATGAVMPELADAVARALVAGGARVVLRGPTSASCLYCAQVTVSEVASGSCRIALKQEQREASASLHFSGASTLFDRARAIAIQTRLLLTWDTGGDARNQEPVTKPVAHRSQHKPVMAPQALQAGAARAETSVPDEVARNSPAGSPVARSDQPAPEPTSKPTRPSPATPALPVPPPTPTALFSHRAPAVTAHATRRWPWIPTAVGGGAAIAAGACALVARDRYNALSDRSQSYASALAAKQSGQSWQWASFALAGVATLGLGTGMIGFWGHLSLTAQTAPLPGGGMVAIEGDWP